MAMTKAEQNLIKYSLSLEVTGEKISLSYRENTGRNGRVTRHPTNSEGEALYSKVANFVTELGKELEKPVELEGRVA